MGFYPQNCDFCPKKCDFLQKRINFSQNIADHNTSLSQSVSTAIYFDASCRNIEVTPSFVASKSKKNTVDAFKWKTSLGFRMFESFFGKKIASYVRLIQYSIDKRCNVMYLFSFHTYGFVQVCVIHNNSSSSFFIYFFSYSVLPRGGNKRHARHTTNIALVVY